MVLRHASTPAERAQWVSQLIAGSGVYGVVSALSRSAQVSRQTLYEWKARALAVLEQLWRVGPAPTEGAQELERAILTLWGEGHASERGIQSCLEALGYRTVSVGSISAVLAEAQQRALAWMARQPAPPDQRSVALDEIFGNDRQGAYLSIVDTRSWAVWASAGPVAVDQESWTLLLWEAQERGLRWQQTVSDGGAAMQAACAAVDPEGRHARDVWHILHLCSQVQGRLDRWLGRLQAQQATVVRQAARLAAGQRARGRAPVSDVAAHALLVQQAVGLTEGLRYLSGELRRLLGVVVTDGQGRVLARAGREQELAALLALVAEMTAGAPAPQQQELQTLQRRLSLALPQLLVFVEALEPVEQEARGLLGEQGLGLLGWAWQRRSLLGPTVADLLEQLPASWRTVAAWVLGAWEGAVRASSAVENWHSILRPHLAVHRTLTPGMLALLVVWHNHRVFARGARAGHSPLHLSGLTEAPTDWLAALGYAAPAAVAPATGVSLSPALAA